MCCCWLVRRNSLSLSIWNDINASSQLCVICFPLFFGKTNGFLQRRNEMDSITVSMELIIGMQTRSFCTCFRDHSAFLLPNSLFSVWSNAIDAIVFQIIESFYAVWSAKRTTSIMIWRIFVVLIKRLECFASLTPFFSVFIFLVSSITIEVILNLEWRSCWNPVKKHLCIKKRWSGMCHGYVPARGVELLFISPVHTLCLRIKYQFMMKLFFFCLNAKQLCNCFLCAINYKFLQHTHTSV